MENQSEGWLCLRQNSSGGIHLSGFVVDPHIIDVLKGGYETITTWVKPESFPFYIEKGFEIQYDSINQEGYYYCVWDKFNR